MKLEEYKNNYHFYSGKASDVVRQLSFAGIAVVWLFRLQVKDIPKFPNELLLPLIFFCGSLAFDLFHYLLGYIIWVSLFKYQEYKRTDPKSELTPNAIFPFSLHLCMCIKIMGVIIGYYYLIKHFFNSFIQ